MASENENLWIQEVFLNATDSEKTYCFGESGIYLTRYNKLGDLYRAMQAEYGRCISRMYVDVKPGEEVLPSNAVWPVKGGTQQVGWVFQGREKYEDRPEETYVREVWVHVWAKQPEYKQVQVA